MLNGGPWACMTETGVHPLARAGRDPTKAHTIPDSDAYIWPTALLCIVQSLYESIAPYSGGLVSFLLAASGGGAVRSFSRFLDLAATFKI